MTRHRAPRRWTRLATCVAVVDGFLLIVGIPAALIGQAITPDVQPSSIALPSDDPVDVVRRGGPIGPVPAALPTIVPTDARVWEPSRGRVIVDGRALYTPPGPIQVAAPTPEAAHEPPMAAGAPAETADVVDIPPLVGVPDIPPPASEPTPDPEPIVPFVPEPDAQPPPPATEEPQPIAEPTPAEPTP